MLSFYVTAQEALENNDLACARNCGVEVFVALQDSLV